VALQLNVRTWGSGPRTALLVHGFSDDAATWWRVAPAVAELGFTVLAPDLRGHGSSPRASSYALADFADDLVACLPAGADVAVGHSLGALVLGLAAARLQPRRVVYVDPSWLRAFDEVDLDRELPTLPEQLPPGWSAEDSAADLASNALLHDAVAPDLLAELVQGGGIAPPPALHEGAVVLVPELEPALPLAARDAVRAAGYEIVTQPGVGHVMHRDDLDGFLELLVPQLLARAVASG
jgi:pimeloyl-ACP methyl ester carboxylesterase